MSFLAMGSNSLGHLNGMKLNEKENLSLRLNKGGKKKQNTGLCLGGSNSEAHFHLRKGKKNNTESYPARERAQDRKSTPCWRYLGTQS